MTFLKRFVTSILLFGILFVFLYLGICMAGGFIAGAKAGPKGANPQESFQLGQRAGADFVRDNLRAIVFSSFGISFVASLALSFSGILPWCRKPAEPPKLPSGATG